MREISVGWTPLRALTSSCVIAARFRASATLRAKGPSAFVNDAQARTSDGEVAVTIHTQSGGTITILAESVARA
jgi:hypothetical protein